MMEETRRVPGVGVGDDPGVLFLLNAPAAAVEEFHAHRPTLDDLAQVAASPAAAPAPPASGLVDDQLVVVTGQQAGLLGGPLLVAWKALTAVVLARRAGEHLGRPVRPVFWAATEDHDLDEIRVVRYLDRHGDLRKRSYRFPGETPRTPAQDAVLGDDVTAFIDGMIQDLPASSHRQAVAADLAACYRPGQTAGGAFVELLERWFGRLGLQVLEPRQIAVVWADPILQEAGDPRAAELVRQAGLERQGLGLPAPLEPPEGSQAFGILDGQRHRAPLQPGAQPSAGAALRPVWQDGALPTIAYVGGPAEVSYLGQLREVYAWLGVTPAVVWPRASGTLLPAAARQTLAALEVDLACALQGHGLEPGAATCLTPTAIREQLERLRAQLEEGLAGLETTLATEAGLGKPISRTRASVAKNLERLERRVEEHFARQAGAGQQQRERLRALLLPRGQLQERTLALASVLAREGPAVLDRMLAAIDPLDHDHIVIT